MRSLSELKQALHRGQKKPQEMTLDELALYIKQADVALDYDRLYQQIMEEYCNRRCIM